MLIKYEMPIKLLDEDIAPSGEPRTGTLLRLFQSIAGAHASSGGVGFDDLIKRDLIWVVTKIKYKIIQNIVPGVQCTLVTYPMPNGSLMYQRDFYIYTSQGDVAVVATSQWCIINYLTRRVEQVFVGYKGEYYGKNAIAGGIPRLRPRDLSVAGKHVVQASDLDENDHTNNCRYADMAMDILNPTSINEFTINFAKETRLGDEILLYKAPGGAAAGKLPDGTLVFAAEIK